MTVGDAAWVLALPCAALAALAVIALGPPLGSAFFTPDRVHFVAQGATPEPTEHARYLIAAAAPFALAAIIAARGRAVADTPLRRAVARAGGPLLLAFVVFALVAQRLLAFRGPLAKLYPQHRVYFTAPTLVATVLIAAGLAVALHRTDMVERVRALVRETPAKRLLAGAIVVLLLAAWMLTVFNTEATIGATNRAVADNIPFWLDETFAILNGLAPLASFHAQYGQLWPYVTAGAMALLGTTFAVYASVMIAGTVATMLAVFATLRRVAGSSLVALALFAPFVATSFFKEQGSLANRYGPANLFSLFPIRYGGPYVLAWLIARHLDGRRPRGAVVLCGVAGVVAINNPEFGGPAFAATMAALLWTLPRFTWRDAARVGAAGLAGVGTAIVVATVVTVAAAGTLPRFGLLFEFSRTYALDGFGMLPMPSWGFHLAIYVTFATALVLATVRAAQRERSTLTGLLCWIGVFGLGAGGYYAGRSHPEVLIDVFSPWAFALALLLVAVVRSIQARPATRRWPTSAELAVLLGFGLTVCSIAQTPTPWSQIARLGRTTVTPEFRPLAMERFVRQHSTPGEHVAMLLPLGHRIAYDTGVKDVMPYASLDSMPTTVQWQAFFRAVQEQNVRSAFVPTAIRNSNLLGRQFQHVVVAGMIAAGFRPAESAPPSLTTLHLVR